MQPVHISTHGFPGALNELIARATVNLAFDTEEDRAMFVQNICMIALAVFWERYLASMHESEQVGLQEIMKKGDNAVFEKWMEANMDIFHENNAAQQRANRILAEMQSLLPPMIEDEYTEFRSTPSA